MRLAYHTSGSALSAAALATWIAASKAVIGSVTSPGLLVTVSDPKFPYSFSTAVIADDRETIAGKRWSRISTTVRRGKIALNAVSAAEEALWSAWHAATLGGRVPFVLELPDTREVVAVTARVVSVSQLVSRNRHELAELDLVEWLP